MCTILLWQYFETGSSKQTLIPSQNIFDELRRIRNLKIMIKSHLLWVKHTRMCPETYRDDRSSSGAPQIHNVSPEVLHFSQTLGRDCRKSSIERSNTGEDHKSNTDVVQS